MNASSSLFATLLFLSYFFFFFNDPPPTEIYTLSLHDALPIFDEGAREIHAAPVQIMGSRALPRRRAGIGRRRTAPPRAPAREPQRQAIEVQVDHRRGEQRQHQIGRAHV